MRIDSAGALVSGGASGLGEATVRRLHGAGAHVVIADLNREKGEALAAELGERARFHEANVTDADTIEAAVAAAAAAPAGLRIAVGCAGIGWAQRVTLTVCTLDDLSTPTVESPTLGLARNAQRLYRLTVAITYGGQPVDRFDWWLTP